MEFLACAYGVLLRVVTVDGHLIPWERWQRRELERATRRCACGRPCGSGTSRTCGSGECIARLAR
jgi:hypothetical protein